MRILGITISEKKRIDIGLTVLYGIGRAKAHEILAAAKVSPAKKSLEITADEEQRIRAIVETMKIEGDLRRVVTGNVKRMKDIKSYRGVRHSRHLPTRGQRTRTNSRTVRGNVRKTAGSGRKKVEKT